MFYKEELRPEEENKLSQGHRRGDRAKMRAQVSLYSLQGTLTEQQRCLRLGSHVQLKPREHE